MELKVSSSMAFNIGNETLELINPYCVLDFNLSCDETISDETSSDDDVSDPGPTDTNDDLEVGTHFMPYNTGLIILCCSYDRV